MSFVKGFAEGFINERNRRLEEKNQVDQMTLRYRLEELSKEKERYQSKRDEEKKIIDQSKALAEAINQPSFATKAAQMLRSGMSAAQIKEMYDEGRFQAPSNTGKTVEIPDISPQIPKEPTMADIKIPEGIVPDKSSRPLFPPVDQETPEEAMESAVQKPMSEDTVKSATMDTPVDTTISSKKEVEADPSQFFDDTSGWKYTPPTQTVKIGTFVQEKANYLAAKEAGDTALMARSKRNMDLIREYDSQRAADEARAKGEDVKDYVIVNSQNKREISRVSLRLRDDGQYENVDTGKLFQLPQGTERVFLDKDAVDYLRKVKSENYKRIVEYDAVAQNAADSFYIGDRLISLLNKKGNEYLPTSTSNWLSTIQGFSNNLAQAATAIQNQQQNVNKALESGDFDSYSSEIANLEKQTDSLTKEAMSLSNNLLSDSNKQIAIDKMLYDTNLALLAFKQAAANKQEGRDLNKDEYQVFLKSIGGAATDSKKAKEVILQSLKLTAVRTEARRSDLVKLAERYQDDFNFIPNIYPDRLGDKMKDSAAGQLYNKVYQNVQEDNLRTKQAFDEDFKPQPKEQIIEQIPQKDQIPPELDFSKVPKESIRSKIMELPPGTWFIGPDGEAHRRKK